MKNPKFLVVVITLIAFIALGVSSITHQDNQLRLKDVELKSTTVKLKELQLKYSKLDADLQSELNNKNQNLERIKQLEQTKSELEQQKAELEKQVSIKRQATVASVKTHSFTATAYASPNCGSDPYMAQIYMKESGCRTTALNSIGCYGIGQSCPASKIAHCGSDFACQDAWFRNYAVTRYGSTANAWAVWQQQHWW